MTYERLSGTSVLRDFVELPSQLFEHWLEEPEVLKRHARHHATGEPIPDELVERLQRGAPIQPGLRDGALHRVGAGRHGGARRADVERPDDIVAFERAELERIGLPAASA